MNKSRAQLFRLVLTIGLILTGCSEQSAPPRASSSSAGGILPWLHQYCVEGE